MSLRVALLPVLDTVRSIVGPTQLSGAPGLDIRPNGLTITVRTWPGRLGDTTAGSYSDSSATLAPVPRIRALSSREIAGSGGLYEEGDLLVGPITPAYTNPDTSTGGYSEVDLAPVQSTDNIEVLYLITGPNAGDYRRIELRRGRAFRYELVLRKKQTTPMYG